MTSTRTNTTNSMTGTKPAPTAGREDDIDAIRQSAIDSTYRCIRLLLVSLGRDYQHCGKASWARSRRCRGFACEPDLDGDKMERVYARPKRSEIRDGSLQGPSIPAAAFAPPQRKNFARDTNKPLYYVEFPTHNQPSSCATGPAFRCPGSRNGQPHLQNDDQAAAAASEARNWIQILNQYRKPSRTRSVIELIITVLPLALLWTLMWLALHWSYWLALPLALPAAAFLVRLFMIQHDCGHGAFFHHRLANDWVGRVIGVLTTHEYGTLPFRYWIR